MEWTMGGEVWYTVGMIRRRGQGAMIEQIEIEISATDAQGNVSSETMTIDEVHPIACDLMGYVLGAYPNAREIVVRISRDRL